MSKQPTGYLYIHMFTIRPIITVADAARISNSDEVKLKQVVLFDDGCQPHKQDIRPLYDPRFVERGASPELVLLNRRKC